MDVGAGHFSVKKLFLKKQKPVNFKFYSDFLPDLADHSLLSCLIEPHSAAHCVVIGFFLVFHQKESAIVDDDRPDAVIEGSAPGPECQVSREAVFIDQPVINSIPYLERGRLESRLPHSGLFHGFCGTDIGRRAPGFDTGDLFFFSEINENPGQGFRGDSFSPEVPAYADPCFNRSGSGIIIICPDGSDQSAVSTPGHRAWV